jgi:hypothetical protein
MEGGAILFNEESSSQNPLGLEFVVSQDLMIRINMDLLTTVQHGTVLFQGLHNRQQLFFSRSIITLGGIELAKKRRHRLPLLPNHGAHLILGSICVDVEWLIMVWVL